MSRKRNISTDISTDPKLAAVAEEFGALPLLLYTWAIPHANDFGQIAADATQFRLLVCPALPVKSSEVATAIQQLCEAGLWHRCAEDGREYLQFPPDAWFRHQSYINASKRPNAAQSAEKTEKRQETARNAKKQQETAQNRVSPSPSPSPSESSLRSDSPPNPPVGGSAAKGAGEQDALPRDKNPVAIFAEAFKEKCGVSPHIMPKDAKRLTDLLGTVKMVRFQQAVAGFFRDEWASENGYGVSVFLGQSADRWAGARPKAPARASPLVAPQPTTDPYAHLRKPAARQEAA